MSSNTSFIRPDEFWQDLGLMAGQVIVHLGCGAGFFLIPAAKVVGAEGKAIGVDILPNMLEEVEGRALREGLDKIIQTVRANLEEQEGSTLPSDMADWVLVANILHQSHPESIVRESARVVQPQGQVAIVEWDVGASPLGPPVAKRIAKPDVIEVATEAGLTVEKQFRPSPYHYGLIFKPS